jgi:phospholipase/carboxylesterase
MHDEQRASIVRCERHGLVHDPKSGQGCVLCRSESRGRTGLPRFDRVLSGLLAAIVILLVGGVAVQLGTPLFERALGSSPARAPSASPAPEPLSSSPTAPRPTQGPRRTQAVAPSGLLSLHTKNVIGRTGTLFLPRQLAESPRPLFVLFHGTGQSGAQIVNAFLSEADARGIILLAPDSGRSPDGAFNWQVPDKQGDTSADQAHVAACLGEVFAAQGAHIDPALVFAAGHSGGASSAAYLATNDARFRGFAVLHGGVFPGGLGPNRVPGWFSTGSADPLRPPAVIERAAAASVPHATTVSTHVYPGGHELTGPEIHDLVTAWLGP